MVDNLIEDKELGRLIVRVNPRARNLVFRTKADAIYVSVPSGTTMKALSQAIEDLRGKLLASRQKLSDSKIDLNFRIDADFFKLSLVSGTGDRFFAQSQQGVMQIVCPPSADFSDENLQKWLHKVVEEAMRKNAKRVLPAILKLLAERSGLTFSSVKINSSRGRWGSCSAKKNINLSYFLLLLPRHLIDYVLLHELCHTQEMNHGERFWILMDRFTGGKSHDLRKELKRYRTQI